MSRTEIRKFKEAWQKFDPEGTGYISKDKFPRLLGVCRLNAILVELAHV